MKTFQPKGKEIVRSWYLIDAQNKVLGRLSTEIVTRLMGKNKPSYSAHLDSGDYVVVINAAKVVLTGKKILQKKYRGHSGFPGGFKEVSFEKMKEKKPEAIIEKAVKGMLPNNRLTKDRMRRLFVFKDEKHPYESKVNSLKKETNK